MQEEMKKIICDKCSSINAVVNNCNRKYAKCRYVNELSEIIYSAGYRKVEIDWKQFNKILYLNNITVYKAIDLEKSFKESKDKWLK